MAQAIVHRSLTKLRSAIGDEKNTMCSKFDVDLRELVGVLEDIEPVLEDVEIQSLWNKDSQERVWLRRVRNASYGISDMVDELKDTRPPGKMACISMVLKRKTMSNKMEEMKGKLRMLLQQEWHRASVPESTGVQVQPPSPPPHPLSETAGVQPLYYYYQLQPQPPPPPPLSTTWYPPPPPFYTPWYPPPPPLYPPPFSPVYSRALPVPPRPLNRIVWGSDPHKWVDEKNIIGRGDNKQRIIATLSATDIIEGPVILPIFGLATIGKTTLAAMIFQDTGFGEYKLRIWVDVTPKFDLPKIGHYIISKIKEINLETEHQRGYGNQVSEQEASKGSDGASQISEDETSHGSDGASQISEDETSEGLDGASQVSEDEINKGSDGTSQVLPEESKEGSYETSNVPEEEINKGSDGFSQVLAEEINKGTCGSSKVLEDQKISSGTDGSSQLSEEITQGQGTDETLEVIENVSHGSHEISQIPEEESKDGSDETSQVSKEETIECSNRLSPVTEEEIHRGSDDVDYITKHLHELLNGMKVLIVLDGLWEEDADELERLKRMLGEGIKGSKVTVIVTTCDEGIARKVCTVTPHKVNPLMDDMCWTIIKQQSDFEHKPYSHKQELERIGLQIASKCGGLPLAAQVLGRNLSNQDSKSWAEKMKGDIWSNMRSDKDVIRSLVLSYRSMPPDLRLCFAYCAIFQQGYITVKDDIIHQWIALGLVERSNTLSVTQVAEEYIRRLLDISFLQTAESAASASGNGDTGAILLTMHEMVHALSRSLTGELIVLDDRMGTSDQNNCCRYALLTDLGAKLSSRLPNQLRALHCVGYSKINVGDDAFSFTRCLRVLHLNECSMHKLPDSVCQLRQLGYLNLSGCSWLMTLPESFGGLLNLRYINLSRCSRLMTLPESFGALLNLQYINLSGCSQLMTLPESFGGLLNLWYINLSRCNRLAELPESFGKLKSLTYLDLSFWCCCEGIRVLGGLTSLEHLNLSHPCCYLPQHRQHLVGLKDVLCKLVNLQYLNLSMCMNPIFCYLSEEEGREYIQSCTSGLSNLQHLDLSHNIFLDGLPESLGELQKLHTLDLTGCTRLESVANKSDSLNRIVIRNCRGLESCSFVVRTDDGRFSSNLVQLENVNCQDLEITCLEKVKSREEAQRIRLVEKRNIEKLTFGWTVGSHGSVEEDANLLGELKPPHDLQRLELHGYRATCLPAWMLSISSYLPNLTKVTMEDFLRCRRLPPFAQLPNLQTLVLRRMSSITRIDAGELSGDDTAAAELKPLSNFTIEDMENLEEFNSTYYSASGERVMFRTIDKLVMRKCSKLSFRSLPPRARSLEISDCAQVLSSSRLLLSDSNEVIALQRTAGGAPVAELVIHGSIADWSLFRYLAGLQTLSISQCEGMTSLPQDMNHLNSLQDLKIVCCKQLKSFPDSMKHLTSLHSIHLTECDSIKKLPTWFGCFTSLQELYICKCRALKYLPRGIKGLDNLKNLQIIECPRLENWCKENKKKLGRIQPTYGCTSIFSEENPNACSVM